RKELDRAKNQMKGSLMLSLESSHSRMSKLAKDELVYGTRTSLEEMLKYIERVSVDQVSTVGRKLFAMEHLAITGLGPVSVKSLESYR
ncbi:MAG TPA: insulinase family protein, partial [Nitrospira sp.]|nr:insulinase family protein [Nitrospira sp.]